MAEAGFYILPTASPQHRYLFACKLIEKIYRSGHFCYVLTDSDAHSKQLDDALWTFRAGSFIPHEMLQDSPPNLQQTVLIGGNPIPEPWQSVIVNLSAQLPRPFLQAERILEVLDDSETCKQTGRVRYKEYKQAGMVVNTHKIR